MCNLVTIRRIGGEEGGGEGTLPTVHGLIFFFSHLNYTIPYQVIVS